MKRGMMTFGNQFGLALYDKTRANVGPSQIANDDEESQEEEVEQAPAPAPIPEHKRRANVVIADIEAAKSVADVEAVMKKAVRTLATLKDNYPREYERVQEARTVTLGRFSAGVMQAAE